MDSPQDRGAAFRPGEDFQLRQTDHIEMPFGSPILTETCLVHVTNRQRLDLDPFETLQKALDKMGFDLKPQKLDTPVFHIS